MRGGTSRYHSVKMLLRGSLAFCAVWLMGPQAAWAKMLKVPAEYPKIRDAIAAAQEGDEVVVAPGVYAEELQISRNITVRSQFNGDWSVVRNTVIDCGGVTDPAVVFSGVTERCVLRGFTLTGCGGAFCGQGSRATIEYNIIHDNITQYSISTNYPDPYRATRGTFEDCDGLIRNNIIENNKACQGGAFRACDGMIQNNLIRNNVARGGEVSSPFGSQQIPARGGAFYQCNGTIRNNTVVDNVVRQGWSGTDPATPGGFYSCKGAIVNNIIYHTTMTAALELSDCTSPTYCLFRTLRPGPGNLAGNPRFVNPQSGDFRLQPDSPGIDAGKGFADLKVDRSGIQRGLKAAAVTRGDGSCFDIGAEEALPKPVAVWLPEGGPDQIYLNQAFDVAWALDPSAGTSIILKLQRDRTPLATYGPFNGSSGVTPLTLPPGLTPGSTYLIRGISVTSSTLRGSTPFFTILNLRNETTGWRAYE